MTKLLDHVGGIVPDDLLFAIGRGKVSGYRLMRKWGLNEDIDAGTEDVWENGGIRTLPAAAAVVSTVSTSAEDGVAGDGILTMTIEGLDANYVEIAETITMNGTSAVLTSASFLRINRMYGATAGSTGDAAGVITASISGNAQATITVAHGQTLQVLYTVPAGHTLYIASLVLATGKVGAAANLKAQLMVHDGTADGVWRSLNATHLYEAIFDESDLLGYIAIGEKSELRLQGISDAPNLNLSGSIHGVLVNNDAL